MNRAIEGFLDAPEGALLYYEDVSNQLQVAKTGVYVTLTLTGDAIVVRASHCELLDLTHLCLDLPLLCRVESKMVDLDFASITVVWHWG